MKYYYYDENLGIKLYQIVVISNNLENYYEFQRKNIMTENQLISSL